MSAPLQSGYKAIDPIEFGINWFRPLGAANAIAAKKWSTDLPKPYRWITAPAIPQQHFLTRPVIWVHTLAATYTEARREALRTDRRAQVLVEYPGWPTTMSDGSVATPLFAEIIAAAHEEPYAAESVATRFVTEIRLGFPLVAA